MKKKILHTILAIIIIYADVAFAIKAGIGVMPVDAAINTLAAVLNVKVGTLSILFHSSFFLGQILIEGKNFRKIEFLQILYILLGGTVLNFFLYTVLQDVTFTLYPIRLAVAVIAFFLSAFGVTLILETRLMRTPMDGCVQLMAERLGKPMGRFRQQIDIAGRHHHCCPDVRPFHGFLEKETVYQITCKAPNGIVRCFSYTENLSEIMVYLVYCTKHHSPFENPANTELRRAES